MFRVFMGAGAAVLVLTSCSSESSSTDDSSVLAKLTEEKVCALVSDESIEKALNVEVASRNGTAGGVGPILTYDCRYDTGTLSSFSTEVRATSMDGNDQELLDSAFKKLLEGDGTIGDYQRVTGIGTLAGFGSNAIVGADLEAWDLAVVATIDGQRLLVTASTHGHAEVDQLKTLAQEFLTNLESAARM